SEPDDAFPLQAQDHDRSRAAWLGRSGPAGRALPPVLRRGPIRLRFPRLRFRGAADGPTTVAPPAPPGAPMISTAPTKLEPPRPQDGGLRDLDPSRRTARLRSGR